MFMKKRQLKENRDKSAGETRNQVAENKEVKLMQRRGEPQVKKMLKMKIAPA
jgi:hypothetical protein